MCDMSPRQIIKFKKLKNKLVCSEGSVFLLEEYKAILLEEMHWMSGKEEVSANVSHVRTSHFLFLNVHRYYLDCVTSVPFLFCAFLYLIAVFFFKILLKNTSVQSVRSFREQAGRFVVVVTKQNKTAVTSMWESYFLQFFQKCFILPVGKRFLCTIAIQLSTLQKQC